MYLRRFTLCLMAGILGISTLAGCSSNPTSTTDENNTASEAKDPDFYKVKEPIEIEWWHSL